MTRTKTKSNQYPAHWRYHPHCIDLKIHSLHPPPTQHMFIIVIIIIFFNIWNNYDRFNYFVLNQECFNIFNTKRSANQFMHCYFCSSLCSYLIWLCCLEFSNIIWFMVLSGGRSFSSEAITSSPFSTASCASPNVIPSSATVSY